MFYTHLTQAHKLYFKVKKVFNNVDPLSLIEKWSVLTQRIIELLQNNTSTWIVANPEPLPVEQAFDIAESFTEFGIEVKGYVLNKVLPEDVCQGHPFWKAKFNAQQECRARMQEKAGEYPIKEIPELVSDIEINGFLKKVSSLLHNDS